MSDDFTRDFMNKDLGIGPLSPGTTPRRYEPEGGVKKHNERIHKESRYADEHKNLPFTFSKPWKPKRQKVVKCSGCGSYYRLNINSVGVVCNSCHKYCSVVDVDG